MSTVKTKKVQLGTDATASNNFTIYQPSTPDGTVRIGNGNAEAVTDAVTINSSGNVGIGTSSPATNLVVNTTGVQGLQLTDTSTDSSPRLLFTNDTNTWGVYNNVEDLSFRSGATIGSSSGTERMRISSGGSVRIGTTTNYGLNEKLALYGTSTANNPTIISDKAAAGTASSNHILFNNANGYVGSITTLNSGTAFNTSSDYRLKENVAPMSGSIDRLKQLKPSTWSWVQDGSHGEGFIAHEAQSVVPEAVHGTKDAVDDEGNPVYQGIDQSKLVPLLTAALLEAIQRIEALEAK